MNHSFHLPELNLIPLCLCVSVVVFFDGGAIAQDESAPRQDEARSAPDPADPAMQPRVHLLDETFPYNTEKPLAGTWHGNLFSNFGATAVSLEVTETSDGGYALTGTIAPGNRPHRPITNFEIDGHAIRFIFPLAPAEAGVITFHGEVSEDGQRLIGEAFMPEEMTRREIDLRNQNLAQAGRPPLTEDQEQQLIDTFTPARFELGRAPLPMSLPDPRAYAGQIVIDQDFAFDITLVFAKTPAGNLVGHIDIPAQAVGGWRLDDVKREGDRIIARMGGGTVAEFDGILSDDIYSGTYRQLDTEYQFTFNRVLDYKVPEFDEIKLFGGALVQTSDVTIEHSDGHFLAGTLHLPRSSDMAPGVVLITAEGRHDRNNTIFGHKTFEVIADFLSRRGIAVLRYDDRGAGKSSGRFQDATIEGFASDALAAYNFLRSIEGVHPDQVGFLGHGEGATVAALAAGRATGPAFVVALGGIGVPGWELEVARAKIMLENDDRIDAALRDEYLAALRALYETFLEHGDEEPADPAAPESAILADVAKRWAEAQFAITRALGGTPRGNVEDVAERQLAVMRLAPNSFALRYDPAAAYRAANCPILALWGSLDFAAPPDVNMPPVTAALEGSPHKFSPLVYTGYNHLFQLAETGGQSEYRRIPISMHDEILETVADWIKRTASPPLDSEDTDAAGRMRGGNTKREQREVIGD